MLRLELLKVKADCSARRTRRGPFSTVHPIPVLGPHDLHRLSGQALVFVDLALMDLEPSDMRPGDVRSCKVTGVTRPCAVYVEPCRRIEMARSTVSRFPYRTDRLAARTHLPIRAEARAQCRSDSPTPRLLERVLPVGRGHAARVRPCSFRGGRTWRRGSGPRTTSTIGSSSPARRGVGLAPGAAPVSVAARPRRRLAPRGAARPLGSGRPGSIRRAPILCPATSPREGIEQRRGRGGARRLRRR